MSHFPDELAYSPDLQLHLLEITTPKGTTVSLTTCKPTKDPSMTLHLHHARFQDSTIFNAYPELRDIWPAEQTALAEEAALAWQMGKDPEGAIYVIEADKKIVGITGFFPLTYPGFACLRWHGILPQYRNRQYSRLALEALQVHLKNTGVEKLFEPTKNPVAKDSFLKCGFSIVEDKDLIKMVSGEAGWDVTEEGWLLSRPVDLSDR